MSEKCKTSDVLHNHIWSLRFSLFHPWNDITGVCMSVFTCILQSSISVTPSTVGSPASEGHTDVRESIILIFLKGAKSGQMRWNIKTHPNFQIVHMMFSLCVCASGSGTMSSGPKCCSKRGSFTRLRPGRCSSRSLSSLWTSSRPKPSWR